MFNIGNKVKNKHTGEVLTITERENVVGAYGGVVYTLSDNVRWNLRAMTENWKRIILGKA